MKTVPVMVAMLAAALNAGTALADTIDPFDFTDASRWMVRARVIDVLPDESSSTSIGGDVTAAGQVVPEVDVTYFFTPHIAAELIAATSPHEMGAANTALGNLDLGTVWILPPTLTLQYHFNPEGQIRPYAGAGVNYMYFWKESTGDVASIKYDHGFGPALQAGVDIGIDEHWAVNFDVKKLWNNVDAKLNGGAVTADVDLDPWVIGAGLAYRF